MATEWNAAVKSAQKILGDKAKIPPFSKKILKSSGDFEKAWAEFDKSREDLKKMLVACKKSADSVIEDYEQFQDQIDEGDFGLNLKDKEDQKKIKDARKILHDSLQGVMDDGKTVTDNLRLLDKHLMNIASFALEFKGPK